MGAIWLRDCPGMWDVQYLVAPLHTIVDRRLFLRVTLVKFLVVVKENLKYLAVFEMSLKAFCVCVFCSIENNSKSYYKCTDIDRQKLQRNFIFIIRSFDSKMTKRHKFHPFLN